MKMHDINPENETVLLLLHPMLSSGSSMKLLIADYLGSGYRYLIPDFSNHGEAQAQTYQSAAVEAQEILDYLKEQEISHIRLAFAASLGGVVLFELLKSSSLYFDHLFFEGAPFHEHASILNFILKKIFLGKHRKALANPDLAVKKMSAIYGQETGGMMASRFIAMNEESIKNIVYDCAFVKLPELPENVQRNCIFAYGEKDSDLKKAKKVQPVKYPYAKLEIWKGYDHCTRITENPKEYSEMLQFYLS